MLTYLGTQRTVKRVTNQSANTFKYETGSTFFPSPGSVQQSILGGGVVGNISASNFDSTRSYFLSRGASAVYADTMTAMTADIASVLGVTPQSLLEKSEFAGKMFLSPDAYRAFNQLRDPGNQVGSVTTVENRYSLQYREIRS